MRRSIVLCSAFVSLGSAAADMVQTVVADRPGFSTGTYTVTPGHYNLELGYVASFGHGSPRRITHTAPLLDARIGLTPESEIDLMWSGWNVERMAGNSTSSTSDMAIGGKYRLASHPQFNITALGVLSLPTGSASSGHANPTATIAWNYTLSDTVTAFGVVSLASYVEEGNRRYAIQPAVGLSFSHSAKLGTFVEFYSDVPLARDTPHADTIDAGMTYLLTDSTQLDFNFGLSLDRRSDNFVGTGIAMRF